MSSLNADTIAKVNKAVQSVWRHAHRDHPTLGIVPLNELIGAYPIWFAEIANLTSRTARTYLAKKISQTPLLDLSNDTPLSGFLFAQQNQSVFTGCILVDTNDILARRRFSAAHELGHYLLHFLPTVQKLDTAGEQDILATEGLVYEERNDLDNEITSDSWIGSQTIIPGVELAGNVILFAQSWQEDEANQFAAELLMPTEACLALIASHNVPFGRRREFLANRLSSELLVSREAINWRLANLGIGG